MSETGENPLAFATEETYLHATDRGAEQAMQRLLVVEIEDEQYGLPTEAVSEIIRVIEITEVPRMPAFMLGVISVRGAIIPVLCLRQRLGFQPVALDRSARIVIVSANGQRFGLRVDAVVGLQRFRQRDVESAPAIFGGVRGGVDRFIEGVGRVADAGLTAEAAPRIVIFLDLAMLLEIGDELAAHRAARHGDVGAQR